jgi:hypothetical protein
MEIRIIISDLGNGTVTQITPSGQVSASVQPNGDGIQLGPGMQSGSGMMPPPEILRAAAAMGAQNAGPAPMLSGTTSLGVPQPFILGGSEVPSMMTTAAASDQPAGAAPGSGMYTPTETIEDTGGEI